MLKIEGQLFDVGTVAITDLAKERAQYLQSRSGRIGDEAVSVHSSVLLKLHATGQHGHIHPSDKRLNRTNIKRNQGRILSVVGNRYPFIIITELPSGQTLITTPEEA